MLQRICLIVALSFVTMFCSSFSLFGSKKNKENGKEQVETQTEENGDVEEQAPVEEAQPEEKQVDVEDDTSAKIDEMTKNYKSDFFKMVLILLGLILLVFLTFWIIRRLSHGKMQYGGKAIRVLQRRPISAKSVLYLIETGGKRVLIAESQLEVRALTDVEPITPND